MNTDLQTKLKEIRERLDKLAPWPWPWETRKIDEFIDNARQDIPFLLAQAEALNEKCAQLEHENTELKARLGTKAKEIWATCTHHTDEQRLDAGCPVCRENENAELKKALDGLVDALTKLTQASAMLGKEQQ